MSRHSLTGEDATSDGVKAMYDFIDAYEDEPVTTNNYISDLVDDYNEARRRESDAGDELWLELQFVLFCLRTMGYDEEADKIQASQGRGEED